MGTTDKMWPRQAQCGHKRIKVGAAWAQQAQGRQRVRQPQIIASQLNGTNVSPLAPTPLPCPPTLPHEPSPVKTPSSPSPTCEHPSQPHL